VRFDAVFFDSGGTLIGFPPSGDDPTMEELNARRAERVSAYLKALGKEAELEEVRAKLLHCEEETRRRYRKPHTFVRVIQSFYQAQGWKEKMEEVLCLTEVYAGPRYASWLFPGTKETLKELHRLGLVLGIIANTDWPGWIFDRVWKGYGLLDLFSVRLYSGEEGIAKPDKEIFERAARRAGVQGGRILFVGDTLKVDIKGAKEVGWHVAWRRSRATPSKNLPDFEFDDIRELIGYVK